MNRPFDPLLIDTNDHFLPLPAAATSRYFLPAAHIVSPYVQADVGGVYSTTLNRIKSSKINHHLQSDRLSDTIWSSINYPTETAA